MERRAIASVDLGELKARVERESSARGQTVSGWIRLLVQRELERGEPPEDGAAAGGDDDASAGRVRGDKVYRAWLDAEGVDKLDRLVAGGGFRTRASALRAVLDGFGLDGGGAAFGAAVAALGTSNHELVGIGRNLSRIAAQIRAQPGGSGTDDPEALRSAERAIRAHLETAAVLVGQLRPMLRAAKGAE